MPRYYAPQQSGYQAWANSLSVGQPREESYGYFGGAQAPVYRQPDMGLDPYGIDRTGQTTGNWDQRDFLLGLQRQAALAAQPTQAAPLSLDRNTNAVVAGIPDALQIARNADTVSRSQGGGYDSFAKGDARMLNMSEPQRQAIYELARGQNPIDEQAARRKAAMEDFMLNRRVAADQRSATAASNAANAAALRGAEGAYGFNIGEAMSSYDPQTGAAQVGGGVRYNRDIHDYEQVPGRQVQIPRQLAENFGRMLAPVTGYDPYQRLLETGQQFGPPVPPRDFSDTGASRGSLIRGLMQERPFVGADPQKAPAQPEKIPTLTSKAEFDALPPGAIYVRNGKRYRKPS